MASRLKQKAQVISAQLEIDTLQNPSRNASLIITSTSTVPNVSFQITSICSPNYRVMDGYFSDNLGFIDGVAMQLASIIDASDEWVITDG